MKFKTVLVHLLFVALFANIPKAWGSCDEAKKLFERSLNETSKAKQKELLLRAVNQCPSFAEAYNNLGLIYEEEGNLQKAVEAYQKATKADPSFPHPYAGLGDAYRKMNKCYEAVKAYTRFLDLLNKDDIRRKYPDVTQFKNYIENNLKICEARLTEKEKQRLNQEIETSQIVSAKSITTALTKRTRGINVAPRIPIKIHFASGSDQISPESLPQMEEIAKALMSEGLKTCRIAIEGHTDSVGSAAYNMDLSIRRAESVKRYLVEHYGIPADRLITRGFGETRPVASNDTVWGRAQNRRVELVNLGPMIPIAQPPGNTQNQITPPQDKKREPIKIAILELDFLQRSSRSEPLGRMVSEFLTTSAANTGAFSIVERSLLNKVMKELELEQSGLVEESQAREIGRMVGADAVLTGSVSKLGSSMRIDARLINVETGKIMAAASELTQGDLASLSRATDSLIRKLLIRLQ